MLLEIITTKRSATPAGVEYYNALPLLTTYDLAEVEPQHGT